MDKQIKKVCLLCGIYPPDIGGPAIYSQRLAKELVNRGIQTIIICYADKSSQKDEDGVKVIRISRKLGLSRFLSYLRHVWQLRNSDLFYAQTLFSAGIPGLIISQLFGKKLAVKITGDHAWERFNKGETMEEFQSKKHGWQIEFVKKMQTYLLKRVSKIIVPSQYLKRIIFDWGVPSQKIEVVYNALAGDIDLSISKEEAERKIKVAGKIILSVGRLMPWKGFNTLIEIMPDLLKKNPELCLVIVGDGPEAKNLKAQISNLKIEDKVKLTGRIDHEQMYLYFRAADLFVLNTNYEGLSHVILEAMQAGLSIITTNIGGNPELIENEKNGILTDYNNKEQLKQAVWRLTRDKDLQEKFRQNSKEKLKEFTWQNTIDGTLAVFDSL